MNDDDRLSVAAYLESRGAWTTEIANEETREFGSTTLMSGTLPIQMR